MQNVMDKKQKIKYGNLTIYCKSLEKNYYDGRVSREEFTVNVLPELAHELIMNFILFRNGSLSQKIAYIPSKNGELAIPFNNIDTINFNV